jgi:hypothetical protein
MATAYDTRSDDTGGISRAVFGVTSLGFKVSCPLFEFVTVVPDIVVLVDKWCATDPIGSSLVLRSTDGDIIPSGHPGAGLMAVAIPGAGAPALALRSTWSWGGRWRAREDVDGVFPACPRVAPEVPVDPLVMMEDALRAACFCWATAIGERISLMCLSIKTGFFLASLSFWKRRRGFSS